MREATTLRGRGAGAAIQSAFAWLPFVSKPEPVLFDPRELQRDVVRLRRLCADEGFPRARIRYDVRKDDEHNRVDVTMIVDQGPPLILRDVRIEAADSAATLAIPEDERRGWEKLQRSLGKMKNDPMRRQGLARIEREVGAWWQERGHPYARTTIEVEVDSSRNEAIVQARVDPGTFARVSDVVVEGTSAIRPDVVERELPFREGDRYSSKKISEGQRDVQSIQMVRLALVDLPAGQPRDSTVEVRVRVTEAEPRLVSGALGFGSETGIAADASWTHRNVGGRAQSLTFAGVAQTGWLAIDDNPDTRYRGSVTLKEPYFFDRHASLLITPFVEFRDDVQDRSLQYGVDLTPLYQFSPLYSVALTYGISRRDVYEYRFGDFTSGDVDLLTLLQQGAQALLDTLGTGIRKSQFTLTATVGSLDEPAMPHHGVLFRPSLLVTTPEGLNSSEYSRFDGAFFAYAPLGRRTTLAVRATAGRLFPFGKSLPGPNDDPTIKFLQLRDVTFTAGGSNDVRGWGNRLLGPKFPDIRSEESGDTTRLVAEGYVPVGGFQRFAGSIELQLPLPGVGPNWGANVFLDAGRVWTSDDRFSHGIYAGEQERMFYSTGAELAIRTPVGPIRLGAGYKLNPSTVDVVDSADLLEAVTAGRPIEDLPKHKRWRWQMHLAIGSSF
ncbi:MAG TPA: BamA/TamA family outer membrane protein [Candidatus Eisenbacteria bacterium]|nr:BamA/TamA family outer membrane protein [Candidatus Eisenbacteria bacterium]